MTNLLFLVLLAFQNLVVSCKICQQFSISGSPTATRSILFLVNIIILVRTNNANLAIKSLFRRKRKINENLSTIIIFFSWLFVSAAWPDATGCNLSSWDRQTVSIVVGTIYYVPFHFIFQISPNSPVYSPSRQMSNPARSHIFFWSHSNCLIILISPEVYQILQPILFFKNLIIRHANDSSKNTNSQESRFV